MKYKAGTRNQEEMPIVRAKMPSLPVIKLKRTAPTMLATITRRIFGTLSFKTSFLEFNAIFASKVTEDSDFIINRTIKAEQKNSIKANISNPAYDTNILKNRDRLIPAQKIRLQKLSLLQRDLNQFINVNFIVYIIALIVPYFLILRKNNQPRIGSI